MLAHRRKRARGVPKASTVGIYASIFALVVAIVAVGYHAPQQMSGIANASPVATGIQAQTTSLDQVIATSVAANLATTTNLSVAGNVAESAASAQINSELSQANTTVIDKPQILQPGTENRSVTTYIAKAGDTANSVAVQFGISVNTVKWANDLTGDAIAVGSTLTILPTDGVLYTVKAGDTLQTISTKYGVDPTRVTLYNDIDVSGITVGKKLILPGATLPNTERPGYVAPITTAYVGFSSGFGGDSWRIRVGNPCGDNCGGYAFGNCTAYAWYRRTQLGLPVGSQWGNASTWAMYASAAGYTVNNHPAVGAIMQNGGYLGHVAIVEKVMPNGDVQVSEMNASVAGGGFNVVDGRVISASYAAQYLYIH